MACSGAAARLLEREAGSHLSGQSSLPTPPDDSGHWAINRHSLGRGGERCDTLQEWPAIRGMAGTCVTPALHRRQAAFARDQQTGRYLPPQVVRPWGTSYDALDRTQERPAKSVAPSSPATPRHQSRRGGVGEQKCTDCLGIARHRSSVHARTYGSLKWVVSSIGTKTNAKEACPTG
jgi:hypothetical protein